MVTASPAQEYGEPDRAEPGDAMIQAYLRGEAERIHASFTGDLASPEAWRENLPRWREEYLYMLGLWPPPERTPLDATITGTVVGSGFVVEKLHYQSRPRLYVTASLYRPSRVDPGERFPAVLYVCGHSGMGRNGNKTAFQSHGIWFARHGYVCLVVDTLQLGEIAALHHGTYREGRWWWHSRGYTPAGVECWNGVRGIDYLVSRPDVDPARVAVTGISGGGAATFWVSAADERVGVAVPVSGMADLPSYVSNRVINGHCDCMFLYNAFEWPWTRIASLLAPRPQLFVNSDEDRIFPMDANERVINRLERVYSLHGAGDLVDSVVSIGGHAYRRDIREAAFRFINVHLRGDPRPVTDSEVDLVRGSRDDRQYPITPEDLRVFPEDADLPADELNTTIDESFVPMASVDPPAPGAFDGWRRTLLAELRRVTLRSLPEEIPAARVAQRDGETTFYETEPGIEVRARTVRETDPTSSSIRVVLAIAGPGLREEESEWLARLRESGGDVLLLEPRGVGPTRWTRKNPPNYVERSHVLLGRTVDTGRIRDVIAVARALREERNVPVSLAGEGWGAAIAIWAAALDPKIASVELDDPPASHMDAGAPQLLNVLRVCDLPDAIGMLAPRPVRLRGEVPAALEKARRIYAAAGAEAAFEGPPAR